jgi:flagellar hook-associated protein 3 FlgL
MRVTNQLFYQNFANDHNKIYDEINKINTQISSGKKIEHAYDDSTIFSKSLRLESEISNLQEVKSRTAESKLISDTSDSILSEFDDTLRNFKTKLINAANSTLNSDNYEAIANELMQERDHMINLANSKVNNTYIFTGTNTSIKPIDSNGNYYGNDKSLETIVSKDTKIPFSINGSDLFLGESNINKTISTNIQLKNVSEDRIITGSDKIEDLLANSNGGNMNFFISGMKGDGSAFRSIKSLAPNTTIDDLLISIGEAYGNSGSNKFVDVSLSSSGNIEITDVRSGKSSLGLKIVGFQGGNSDTQTDLSLVTYDNIIEFTKSSFSRVDNSLSESMQIDSFYFTKDGATLRSNNSLFKSGDYVDNTTLLKDITNSSMDLKEFQMELTNIEGDKKSVTLKLANQSSFTIDGNGNSYHIFNADGTYSKADELTMGQLNSVISMVLSNKIPSTTNNFDNFNKAIKESKELVDVSLDSRSRLSIKDRSNSLTDIEFSIFDKDANDFTKTTTPSISFMTNDLVTIKSSQIDFFKDLDEIIQNVREGKVDINTQTGDPRHRGIQSAIDSLDQFSSHFSAQQSKLGAMSRNLELESDKAATMELNIKTLKSEVADVDLAATILKLNQITLNYQAMLSTSSKVSSLSLLNYLK